MLRSPMRIAAVAAAGVVAAAAIALVLVERRTSSTTSALTPTAVASPGGPAPTGRSGLVSVACPSAAACLAAGFRSAPASPDVPQPLVERWDGTSWSPAPAPIADADAQLEALACTSVWSCVAVGYVTPTGGAVDEHALVATWDGAAWSVPLITGIAGRGSLRSVACPTPSSCVAVGSLFTDSVGHQSTLVVAWNGAAWSVVPSPAPGTDSWLNAVACTAAASCVAVGSYSDADPADEDPDASTLVEVWAGGAWSVVPSPNPGTGGEGALLSVACASPVSCVTVGSYSGVNNPYRADSATLAETWDGTAWALATTASPGKRGVLRSVACTPSGRCVAVGSYETGAYAGDRQTLVEAWDGSAWSETASESSPRGSRELDAIACTSSSACVAVGQASASAHAVASSPLEEAWDGAVWRS